MEAKEMRRPESKSRDVGMTVNDVMRARPKTLPVNASISDLRQLFINAHVTTALIIDGKRAFAGVIERSMFVNTSLPDGAPITDLIQAEVDAIDVRAPAANVWEHRDLAATGRLVVLEPDGRTLAGLVCVCATPGGGMDFCRRGLPPVDVESRDIEDFK